MKPTSSALWNFHPSFQDWSPHAFWTKVGPHRLAYAGVLLGQQTGVKWAHQSELSGGPNEPGAFLVSLAEPRESRNEALVSLFRSRHPAPATLGNGKWSQRVPAVCRWGLWSELLSKSKIECFERSLLPLETVREGNCRTRVEEKELGDTLRSSSGRSAFHGGPPPCWKPEEGASGPSWGFSIPSSFHPQSPRGPVNQVLRRGRWGEADKRVGEFLQDIFPKPRQPLPRGAWNPAMRTAAWAQALLPEGPLEAKFVFPWKLIYVVLSSHFSGLVYKTLRLPLNRDWG